LKSFSKNSVQKRIKISDNFSTLDFICDVNINYLIKTNKST
jgi:hypothetical protein